MPAKHASPPAEGPALAKSVPGKIPISVIDGPPLGGPKAATKKPRQATTTSFWDLGKPARKPAAPQRSVLPLAAPQRSVMPPADRVEVEVNAPPSAMPRATAAPSVPPLRKRSPRRPTASESSAAATSLSIESWTSCSTGEAGLAARMALGRRPGVSSRARW